MTQILPYGSWPSPLSAEAAAAGTLRLDGARFVGDDVWWGETIAAEGGRTAVRRASGDVLPPPWNARSRVHEYGGGSWTASDDGTLLFVEKTDQRVWMLRPGTEPVALTPDGAGMRFGGLTWQHGRLLAVRETHGEDAPRRDLVEIGLDGSLTSLVAGSDFVAHPALSANGRLAWIAWNHPDMAWDRAELRVGGLVDGTVPAWTVIAGGASSPVQPEWAGEELLFADDVTGRWNLYDSEGSALAPADADTGGPVWVLGTRWFGVLDGGRIVAIRTNGTDEVVVIDPATQTVRALDVPSTALSAIEDVRGSRVLVSGANADSPAGLWVVDVDAGTCETVRGGESLWGREWMPRPQPLTIEGPQGTVHAFAYPPTNPDVSAADDELPPYVVFVHGGPTAHVAGAASAKIAYLTSRGIGVLDVNYGGSTGYGRAYRERLRGLWGVIDVEDVIAAAHGLAASGMADARRLAIAGGSAGGWTVLCALVRSDVFSAGIDRYSVVDLRSLARDTHDFESRYFEGLVGPLPEAEAVYIERSPLTHLERLRTPLLIEQGLEDEIVPPNQSEALRDALAANGVPHAYLVFEGEGHGFRRSETIVETLQAELAFLGHVLGFDTPGVPPLELS